MGMAILDSTRLIGGESAGDFRGQGEFCATDGDHHGEQVPGLSTGNANCQSWVRSIVAQAVRKGVLPMTALFAIIFKGSAETVK